MKNIGKVVRAKKIGHDGWNTFWGGDIGIVVTKSSTSMAYKTTESVYHILINNTIMYVQYFDEFFEDINDI